MEGSVVDEGPFSSHLIIGVYIYELLTLLNMKFSSYF